MARTITKLVEKSGLLKQTSEFKIKLTPIKNYTNGNQLAFRYPKFCTTLLAYLSTN